MTASPALTHITVQLSSGRVVRARIVGPGRDAQTELVTWAGLAPFPARALTHEDILNIEAQA